MYAENYKKLMKKIKDLINGGHTMFMDWKLQRSNDINSLQINIQVSQNFYKIPARSFMDIDMINLKFTWKGTRLAKIIVKVKN